jgi:hypothetical protein
MVDLFRERLEAITIRTTHWCDWPGWYLVGL